MPIAVLFLARKIVRPCCMDDGRLEPRRGAARESCWLSFRLGYFELLRHEAARLSGLRILFGQVMVLLWSCISVPLCLLGTVVGRNWAGLPDNPCRVKRIPSPIPQKQVVC